MGVFVAAIPIVAIDLAIIHPRMSEIVASGQQMPYGAGLCCGPFYAIFLLIFLNLNPATRWARAVRDAERAAP